MITRLLPTGSEAALEFAVTAAVEALRDAQSVALPTETVYGLAADALRPEAVVKIFEAKKRPYFDPLIVHLPSHDWLERLTAIPDESRALVEALSAKFWPGPLTLVLPRRDVVPDLVTAGLETVAVRMSAHPVFRAVIVRFGHPLAAPSANRFGRISPTAAGHVHTELDGRIPLIVDGGATEHGLESTIVKVAGAEMEVLRAGPITQEDLVAVWIDVARKRHPPTNQRESTRVRAKVGISACGTSRDRESSAVQAPGQLKSHYAPRTPLRFYSRDAHLEASAASRIGFLAFAQPSTAGKFVCEEVLSPTGDLREAAATLFAKMRRLDEAGLDLILAERVPENGLGIAIMDRLRKAAAEHAD